MKKIILYLVTVLLVLNLVGCSNDSNAANNGDATETTVPVVEESEVLGSLEEIMKQVYDGTGLEFAKTVNTVINEENIAYFLGTNEIAYTEAVSSEPMISSVAHSVALIRVEDGADIEDIKAKIKASVDPIKWICVGVEEDEVIVDSIGNLVILIMDVNAETIHQSFLALEK